MTKKTITLSNGNVLSNVDLTRWVADPNFYKVYDRCLKNEMLINVNQIFMIMDYREISLSDLPPVHTY